MGSVVMAAGTAAAFPTEGAVAAGRMVMWVRMLVAAMAGFFVIVFVGMGTFIILRATGAARTGCF